MSEALVRNATTAQVHNFSYFFSGEFENEDDRDSDLEGDEPNSSAISNENLCLPALKYLTQCCSILASMWSMPACPVFDGAIRLVLTKYLCFFEVTFVSE